MSAIDPQSNAVAAPAYAPKYSDEDYLGEAWFDGGKGDCDVRNYQTKMVTTRKPHTCFGNGGGDQEHVIPAGTRALHETCIFDGEWASNYLCCMHMDEWLDEVNGVEDESDGE